jgi:hypothetical protein
MAGRVNTPLPRLTAYCPVCGCEVGTFRVRRHLTDDHTRTEVLRAAWRTSTWPVRIIAIMIPVAVVSVIAAVAVTVLPLLIGESP